MTISLPFSDMMVQPTPACSSSTQSTLWMGDLETWMDEQYIQQLWYHWNDQIHVKLIRDKTTGLSSGYCFIDFGTHLMAQQIMSIYQGKRMPHSSSKTFKLNWASGGGLFDKKHDRLPEYSIFVGDLPLDCSDTVLFRLFQTRYSSCKAAKIMTDPTTGQSRGYGFVRFYDRLDQQRALIEMQGFLFAPHRPIRVSMATPKQRTHHQSSPSSPLSPSSSSSSSSAPLTTSTSATLMPLFSSSSLLRSPTPTPTSSSSSTTNHNTTIFVGGLSAPIKEDDLRHYFTPFGDIVYVKIPVGKGCGFVQYVSHASAALAIQHMNGYQIGSCRIRLSWGKQQQHPPQSSTVTMSSARVPGHVSMLPPLSSIPSSYQNDLKPTFGLGAPANTFLNTTTTNQRYDLPPPSTANGRTSTLSWPLNHIYAQ